MYLLLSHRCPHRRAPSAAHNQRHRSLIHVRVAIATYVNQRLLASWEELTEPVCQRLRHLAHGLKPKGSVLLVARMVSRRAGHLAQSP